MRKFPSMLKSAGITVWTIPGRIDSLRRRVTPYLEKATMQLEHYRRRLTDARSLKAAGRK